MKPNYEFNDSSHSKHSNGYMDQKLQWKYLNKYNEFDSTGYMPITTRNAKLNCHNSAIKSALDKGKSSYYISGSPAALTSIDQPSYLNHSKLHQDVQTTKNKEVSWKRHHGNVTSRWSTKRKDLIDIKDKSGNPAVLVDLLVFYLLFYLNICYVFCKRMYWHIKLLTT